jgi:methylmalonyl-CoA mutase
MYDLDSLESTRLRSHIPLPETHQKSRLEQVRASRDEAKVKEALAGIEAACRDDKKNILSAAIVAARERATLGEISDAIEQVYGRYKANTNLISGVFSNEMKNNKLFNRARELSDAFAEKEGRRPRILIAKMGQDGHDRGAKIIATAFADMGFDVDISPMFQTPKEIAKQSVENDVHILGISSLAGGHKTLVEDVKEELKKWDRDDIKIVVGGVIPPKDYDYLYSIGVSHIFGPGSNISQAAIDILEDMKY